MANLESDMILSVKDATGCSERAAQTLLKLTGNNVEAAIEYYKSKKALKKSYTVSEPPSVPLRRPTLKVPTLLDGSTVSDGLEALNDVSASDIGARNSIMTGTAVSSTMSPPPVPRRPIFPTSQSIDRPQSIQNSYVPFQPSPSEPVQQNPLQPQSTQYTSPLFSPFQQEPPINKLPALLPRAIPPQYSSDLRPPAAPGNSFVEKELRMPGMFQASTSQAFPPSQPMATQTDQPTLVLRGDGKWTSSEPDTRVIPAPKSTQNAPATTAAKGPALPSVSNVWDPSMRTRSNSQMSEQPDVFSPSSERSGLSSRSSTINPVLEENPNTKEARPPSYITIEEKDQVEQEEEMPVDGRDFDKVPHWNFQLPRLPAQLVTDLDMLDEEWVFDAYTFACSLQHQVPFDKLKGYLQKCSRTSADPSKLQDINVSVVGFPLMFYVVETNNDWLVQELYHYGGNVNAVKDFPDIYSIPLIAFAIINRLNLDKSTTQVVERLLSLGATAGVFPKAFYEPLCQDLPASGPRDDKLTDMEDAEKAWCRPEETRRLLTRALDITLRYYVAKSLIIERPGKRARQVAKRRNGEALFGVPYMMIGQISAASMVTDRLISHLMYQDKKPTVLVFAGPSGHGKTELARKLGYLLSLDLEIVDCTTYSDEKDLFGFRKGWQGSKEGSRLNNFLARKNGQQGIVFLDEFEKTTTSVHNALLIPFDNGEYQDRRNDDKIDCSKIIWILATNAIDDTIMAFWDDNEKGLDPENPDKAERKKLLKRLSKEIQKEFKGKFKPPITGRITDFIPFLPFSSGEQVVGAHKYVLEFTEDVRKPVTIDNSVNRVGLSNTDQLLGGIRLCVQKDVALCKYLAEEYYDKDLGIRSLKSSVKDVKKALVKAYLAVDEDIESTNDKLTDYVVDLQDEDIVAFVR